MTGHWNY